MSLELKHGAGINDIKIDILNNQKNIILLSDRKITENEEEFMCNLNFSTNRFNPKRHKNKSIKDIGESNIFIIEIDCPVKGRSKGMKFYETNSKFFDEYIVVYLRTSSDVRKDNIGKLNANNVIADLPENIDTKEDYIRILLSNKMPQVRNICTKIWHWANNTSAKKN